MLGSLEDFTPSTGMLGSTKASAYHLRYLSSPISLQSWRQLCPSYAIMSMSWIFAFCKAFFRGGYTNSVSSAPHAATIPTLQDVTLVTTTIIFHQVIKDKGFAHRSLMLTSALIAFAFLSCHALTHSIIAMARIMFMHWILAFL